MANKISSYYLKIRNKDWRDFYFSNSVLNGGPRPYLKR